MESRKLLPFTPHPVIFNLCLLLPCTYFTLSHSAKLGNDTDKLALLAFKNQITHDPTATLSNWNDSIHFCRWNGVICGARHERVVVLDLQSRNLTGTISPHIGNLTFVRSVNLRYNYFHGEIPKEVGRLYRLQVIGLTQNLLQGEISINLTQCPNLRILDLVANSLKGRIPPELGKLEKLTGLGLAVNNLTGPIPKSLANLTFLREFSLSENRLSGDIPRELGQLRLLRMFQISSNGLLTGSIPAQLFNLSLMEYFAVAENQLVLEIPPDIGFTLPNVRVLLLGKNQLYGSIPSSISNATKLEWLFISSGQLTGSIPQDLGKLKNLVKLNLGMNELGNGEGNDLGFLSSLVNCTKLEVLAVNNNSLSGVLPNQITNLSSNLNYLLMGANRISGSIPYDIQKLENLILIGMEENLFTGQIPASFGLMKNLQGNIPSTLGNCQSLQRLSLANNNLSGTIPKEVIGIPSITDCFGILVMEMFTGKKPTDEMFMEDLSLHSYVNKAIPEGVTEIVDVKLLEEVFHHQDIDRATTSRKQSKAQESLTSILKIGILCSTEQPGERLDMKEVVMKLQSLREMIQILAKSIHGLRRFDRRFFCNTAKFRGFEKKDGKGSTATDCHRNGLRTWRVAPGVQELARQRRTIEGKMKEKRNLQMGATRADLALKQLGKAL
ncbi:hypothetical protein NL676_006617 [Syzygium grande]|nr:hypothetical protein NL676_006617 [Syzygium grande]